MAALPDPAPVAVVVSADPGGSVERFRIATDLRAAGLAVRPELGTRKLGRQIEAADREGAHFVVILGDELADGQVGLKDLKAGTQKLVALADLARELARADDAHHHGGPDS
jgi:histidyl-tRNA synthetase